MLEETRAGLYGGNLLGGNRVAQEGGLTSRCMWLRTKCGSPHPALGLQAWRDAQYSSHSAHAHSLLEDSCRKTARVSMMGTPMALLRTEALLPLIISLSSTKDPSALMAMN